MNVRLRDFFITKEDWIFSVVDYDTRSGLRSTLRYVPDERGDRIREEKRYRKLSFDESLCYLRDFHPEYLQDVAVVPQKDVKMILRANERLISACKRNEKVRRIASFFSEKGIPLSKMGITGSFLCSLEDESSDIDFVVYGNSFFDARNAIEIGKRNESIEDLDEDTWRRIYEKRNPEISYEEFLIHEKRKKNRGMIKGTYFDLLYVRDWHEIGEGFGRGKVLGKKRIEGVVKDAKYSFDSPAIYEIDHESIKRVLSFTHTYAGQVFEGEILEARGVVEKKGNETMLIVGTTREGRGEWIRSKSLMERRFI
ncbi:MAG: nucleotidyltransferase domain-containing protein [Candidatus Syntropharchaeia archaeon]